MTRQSAEAQARTRAFRAVFQDTEAGKTVLSHLMRHCQYGARVFNSESDRQTAYNLGRQEVAVWVAEILAGTADDKE